MSDLAEFLLARIAEDEAAAVPGAIPDWGAEGREVLYPSKDPRGWVARNVVNEAAAQHIARWDPARVLAECEAKRRIVEIHQASVRAVSEGLSAPTRQILQLLALPYADHPDYREEWRP